LSEQARNHGLGEQSLSMWASGWRRFRRHKLALLGSVMFCIVLLLVVLGPVVSPYRMDENNYNLLFKPPSSEHILGTDDLGRDVFVRIMMGGRISLIVGLVGAMSSALIGVLIGGVAALTGGSVDNFLMRLTDVMLSIPTLPLLMVAALFFGGGLLNIIIILAVFGWMGTARLVRGNILSLRQQDFVEAAVAAGARPMRILWRHLVPNTLSIIIVSTTLRIAGAILYESSLSYLGLGIQPPTPSWGNILQRSMTWLLGTRFGGVPWWIIFFSGAMILVTVLAINFVGDGLRDAFDPKSVL